MPKGLRRIQGGGDFHFITCSCYRRLQFLSSARRRDLFLNILEEVVSRRCRSPRTSAKQMRLWKADSPPAFWQPRYYDFNVYSGKKKVEKLRYIHRNPGVPSEPAFGLLGWKPVTRRLVESPEQWRWSSYRYYQYGEEGPVKIGE